jgi:hypothetical protein
MNLEMDWHRSSSFLACDRRPRMSIEGALSTSASWMVGSFLSTSGKAEPYAA